MSFTDFLRRTAEDFHTEHQADHHADPDADPHVSNVEYSAGDHAKAWVSFFVLSLASGVIAPLVMRIGLPKITGNLFVGALIGRYLLGMVSKDDVDSLKHINTFALAYITTSAGAELHIHEFKAMFRAILAQVTAIELITFAVICVATKGLTASPLSSWTNEMTAGQQWGVSTAMAGIAMARSPATAVAVVRDLKCKGKMTTTFMGITVLSDIAVLIAMALAIAYCRAEFNGTQFEPKSLGIVLAVIIASVLLGGVVGGTYMLLMKFSRFVLHTLVFPIGFLVFLACQYLTKALANGIKDHTVTIQPEPLLMCIVGGFITVNFSKYHHRFIDVLGAGGQYIFLPFFTLVGASLDLEVFVKALPFAVIIAVLRMICIFLGSYSAGYLVGQERKVNLTIWMTLLSQAGFSLGLAAEIGHLFPGWGTKFQAVITSCVVVNQLIGPVLCNTAMKMSGEAGKASGTEAQDEAEADPHVPHVADKNKAAIVGVTDKSKAIALSLLKRRWGVTVVARSSAEAAAFRADVEEWATELAAAEAADRGPDCPFVADMARHSYQDKLTVVAVNDLETAENHTSILKDLVTTVELSTRQGLLRPVHENDIAVRMAAKRTDDPDAADEFLCKSGVTNGRNTSEAVLDRHQPEDALQASSLPKHHEALRIELGSESFVERCRGIYDVLDNTEALHVVVLALDNDIASLALLVSLQNRWGDVKAANTRVLVLVKELVWAEPITMLNAVPLHDFVLSHSSAMLATTTPLDENAVLVPNTPNLDAWSDAYLHLYDGDVLFHCTEQGKMLRNVDALDIGSDAFVAVMSLVREKMKRRLQSSSFLTGGRMMAKIEEWLESKLPAGTVSPTIRSPRRLLSLDFEQKPSMSPVSRPSAAEPPIVFSRRSTRNPVAGSRPRGHSPADMV